MDQDWYASSPSTMIACTVSWCFGFALLLFFLYGSVNIQKMLLHTCREILRNGCGRKTAWHKQNDASASDKSWLLPNMGKKWSLQTIAALVSQDLNSFCWCVTFPVYFPYNMLPRVARGGSIRAMSFTCGNTVTSINVMHVMPERMICAPLMNNLTTSSQLSAVRVDKPQRLLKKQNLKK